MADITVTPQNSPYSIQAGTQKYDKVTISGGYLQLEQQTTLTMTTVDKTTQTKTVSSHTEKK